MGRYFQSENRGRRADKEGSVDKVSRRKWPCAIILFCAAPATSSSAQTFAAIANFNGNNGYIPSAPLVQGSDGNFYGTTRLGGSSSLGTVFRMTPRGALTTLFNFTGANGANPNGGLIQASDGNFYGTTLAGGANSLGTVFRITSSGALTTLFAFTGNDGASPNAGLIQAADQNFYGTTEAGGARNHGAIFRITAAGALTTLYSFNVTDGDAPRGRLVQGTDGNFYGTAFAGGANSKGTVFKINAAGTLTTLYNFDVSGAPVNIPDGANPNAGLIQGRDGNFYGTTVSSGGTNNYGTVFKSLPRAFFQTSTASSATDRRPTPGWFWVPTATFTEQP